MRKKLVPGFIIAVVAAIVLYLLFWPVIDDMLLQVPVSNAINALRSGKTAALRACFTEDAQAVYKDKRIGINAAINAAAPYLASGRVPASIRFGGFTEKRRVSGDQVDTKALIWIYVEGGDDSPYRKVPLRKQVNFSLQRTSWLSYKIREVSSDDGDFGGAIER